ncbi:MAG: NAD-dependent epimerase/dehydratase family protein [Clostridia bacterium]|nr:NAD-dependent epimerase/dehydratase family protein [Clostridia bacterium]
MRILVLGGTGVISRAIVREGLLAGHDMVMLNRGRRKASFDFQPEIIVADWSDPEQFCEKTAGVEADAVIDMLSRTPEDARRTLTAFGGETGQWIFTSTTCAYKKPFAKYPIRESEAERWDDPAYPYAYGKARMEEYVLGQDRAACAPVTVIRPSLTFGEGCANIGLLRQNANILRRIRQGKPLLLYDDGFTPLTFTFAPDLARGYLACCLNPRAYWQDFHITSRNCVPFYRLYEALGKIAGRKPHFRYMKSEKLFALDPARFDHVWYEKRFDHIFSLDKIKTAAPDWKPVISLEAGLKHMAQWWETLENPYDDEKDALEDRLCAMAESND